MRLLTNLIAVALPVLYWEILRRSYQAFVSTSAVVPHDRHTTRIAWITRGVHVLLFALLSWQAGFLALNTPATGLSLLALSLSLVYGWIEWRSHVPNLAVFVSIAVFTFQAFASILGFGMPAEAGPARSHLFAVHVVMITLASATLLLSGFFGVLYIVMERQMRRQTFGLLYGRLPNLFELSAMNRRAATMGFIIMTIGINAGIWQAHDDKTPLFSYRDPKVVATLGLWILFGVIGLSRWVRFLSGRKTALAAVIGLVLIALTMMVSLVPGLTFHRFV